MELSFDYVVALGLNSDSEKKRAAGSPQILQMLRTKRRPADRAETDFF
jgi:hypothetical protein